MNLPQYMPNKVSDALPAYFRLQQLLISQIESGVWTPGMQIPSERELAKEHKISIGTVRKALDKLVQEGYINRIQGKGSFLPQISLDRHYVKYYRMRRSLHGANAELTVTCKNITVVKAPKSVTRNFPDYTDTEYLFVERVLFGKDAKGKWPVVHSASYIPMRIALPMATLEAEEVEALSLYRIIEKYCKLPMRTSDELLKPNTAHEYIASLLELETGAAVLESHMISKSYSERPVEFRISTLRLDEFGVIRTHDFP